MQFLPKRVKRWMTIAFASIFCNMVIFFFISAMLRTETDTARYSQHARPSYYGGGPHFSSYSLTHPSLGTTGERQQHPQQHSQQPQQPQRDDEDGGRIKLLQAGLNWVGGMYYNPFGSSSSAASLIKAEEREERDMRDKVMAIEEDLGETLEALRSAMRRATTLECKRKIFNTAMRYKKTKTPLLQQQHNKDGGEEEKTEDKVTTKTITPVVEFSEDLWKKDAEYWEQRIQTERRKYENHNNKEKNFTSTTTTTTTTTTVVFDSNAHHFASQQMPHVVADVSTHGGGGRAVQLPPKKMRIGFILLVHAVTLQIELLLEALYHPDHFYVLHVDKAARPLFVKNVQSLVDRYYGVGKNIWLVPEEKRQEVTWAGYSMMAAQFASIEVLFENAADQWDYCINLSGADFPMKSVDYMAAYLQKEYPTNFLEIFPPHLPSHELHAFTECDRHVFKVADRPLPKGLPLRRGSQWFVLTRIFFEWLMGNVELFTQLNEFFGDYLFSDEGFIPSIFPLSPFSNVTRHRLHCLVWATNDAHKSKCRHLDEADWCGRGPIGVDEPTALKFMENVHCFFARKFDIDSRWDVLKVVDEKLKKTQLEGGFLRIHPPA